MANRVDWHCFATAAALGNRMVPLNTAAQFTATQPASFGDQFMAGLAISDF
ncbi:MAG: hypothetical protein AAGI92_07935 [Pseudomonadota bacterium]